MKWFKHFTTAHNDNALRKVRMRYGADGYAVYWYCVELIAGDLDSERANFELSHDAEVIGYDLKIDQLRVEEIMSYMVNLELFESAGSTITCMKIAKFLDKKSTRNPEIHAIIDKFTALSETVADKRGHVPDSPKQIRDKRGQSPDSPRLSRLDKTRSDKKKERGARFAPPTLSEVKDYIQERSYSVHAESFFHFYEAKGWMVGKNKMKSWQAAVAKWASDERKNPQAETNPFAGAV